MYLKGFLFYLLFFSFIVLTVKGQEKSELDSLIREYNFSEKRNNLELLEKIVRTSSDLEYYDSVIKYADLIIKRAKNLNDGRYLHLAYHYKGVAHRLKGDYSQAFKALFRSLELADSLNYKTDLGITYVELANAYAESGDINLSQTYFDRGIEVFQLEKDTLSVAKTYLNMGDSYFDKGEMNLSFLYTSRALETFRELEIPIGEAYGLGNLGRINVVRKNFEKAEEQLDKAIEILEEVKDNNALTDFYAAKSDLYLQRGDLSLAIDYAKNSVKAANTSGLKEDLQYGHQKLSYLYETIGNTEEAYDHFKMFILYRDSLENLESIREIANLRSDYEIAKKQTEVNLLNEQKANQRNIVIATIIALFLIMLLALGLYRRNKYIGRTKRIIENEKNRSDLLLLNILPQETALELKEKGKVQAKRFEAVTILFTDFKNFTHYAENLPPEELVKSVDFYFSKFDEIIEQHGLEKIKTVGDAYMCAAGVPFPVEDHAHRAVAAACDMIKLVQQARQNEAQKETRFEIRIGINSGPVVAGVVGHKKWAYDIWGDAVNIAARMETCSETGRINISENTYQLVQDEYECDYRGEIQVKNKGRMKMYFIKDQKTVEQINVA